MTPERYAQIDELVEASMELETAQREDYLTQRCGDDPLLRQEVDAWVRAQQEAEQKDFLESPIPANYMELLASDHAFAPLLASGKARREATSSASPPPLVNYEGMLLNDRYRVDKELGRGNIGVVYRALDQQLHSRPVAIKVLLEASLQNPWFKKKLAQEVEALARIDHPGIVEVLDRGETSDGNPFLVMKFISGQTLRALLKSERPGLPQLAAIVRQIGQALSAAHDQNVVHCDLKPENIMIQTLAGDEQQIKIVDFGVAKIRNSQVAESSEGTFVAGAPGYMAPEHLDEAPTAASDIFSFGVIAYELLTGERPFKGALEGRKDAIRRGLEKSPKEFNPELPNAVQEILLKALAFDEKDRFEQARDFGELLAQALTTDLELPCRAATGQITDLDIAYVLIMDLVGYSKLTTDCQSRIYKDLQDIVSRTNTFGRAKAAGQVISRSTGDSIALAFFKNPKAPVECALEITRASRLYPQLELRMGIHSGPVYRVADMNEAEDVAGAGINMAQRVMDCGDAGHILVSKTVADVLKELAEWRDHLFDLGEHQVKHGVKVHLFNYCGNGVGNPALPAKLHQKPLRKLVVAAIVCALLMSFLAAALVSGFLHRKAVASNPLASVEAIEGGRQLSYAVRVQKYRDGRPFEKPFQYPGADIIFEKDYRLKLDFTSPQSGYFYVLNQPPGQASAVPRLIVLHAGVKNPNASASLNLEFPTDMWLKFDKLRGTETLWLVWSAYEVEVLEAVKGLDNPRDNGHITDPDQSRAIYEFLKAHTDSGLVVSRAKERLATDLNARGDVLVYPLELHHQ